MTAVDKTGEETKMILRSKEDLRKLIPAYIDSKLKYEEDPQNSIIRISGTKSLSSSENKRLGEILLQISEKYGPVKIKKEGSFWKGTIRWDYWVPYKPANEQEAKNLELAGRYEEAAQLYETLGMLEKAGEARRIGRTHYVISTNFQIGKDGSIRIACPYCGASQPAESKSSEVTCKYCGRKYIVPKKILDMI